MRTDGETKQRSIIAPHEAITPRFLTIGPAFRQIRQARDPVVHDGAVPHRWPHHLIPAGDQNVDERLKGLTGDDRLVAVRQRMLYHRSSFETGL
jgi:hypothetical protein